MPTKVPSHKPNRVLALSRHRAYDRVQRNKESKDFYNSCAWQTIRREKLCVDPLCGACHERGVLRAAEMVHHILPIETHPDMRLELTNLRSLCNSCHSRLHRNESMHATRVNPGGCEALPSGGS